MTLEGNVPLLTHAIESSPDGVLIVDEHGIIIYANPTMRTLSGYDQLVGHNVDMLVPADLVDGHAVLRAGYHQRPEARSMSGRPGLSLQRADSTEIPVEISLSPFEHETGKLVIAAVRDISDRLDSMMRLASADEQLALMSERTRIGRDLHDVVLQHLFGMGLSLQAVANRVPDEVSDQLDTVIEDIDRIITEVRTIVFTLGTSIQQGTLGNELADVVAKASRVLGFTPALRMSGPVDTALSDELRSEMVTSLREALANVARHANATKTDIDINMVGDNVEMLVTDNGDGPPDTPSSHSEGYGLTNLHTRAAAFGGECILSRRNPADGPGATLRWTAPH